MKQLLAALCSFLMLCIPFSTHAQSITKTKTTTGDGKEIKVKTDDGHMKVKTDSQKVAYPYTALYSSQFVAGDPAHGKMILDLWKDWENNTLEKHANYIADTIVYFTPDGRMIKGIEDFGAAAVQKRDSFAAVKNEVEVWIPLKSVDQNENWVAIWGQETDTGKDGKVTKNMVHEIWRINKDGKVDFMRQYVAKLPQQ
jgi:hypothetical protein